MSKRDKTTRSGGNVFADLGLPDPEDRMLKGAARPQDSAAHRAEGSDAVGVAPLLGLDQPKVSNLMRGRLTGFSVERPFDILNRLGHNIEVYISEEEYAPDETHTVEA